MYPTSDTNIYMVAERITREKEIVLNKTPRDARVLPTLSEEYSVDRSLEDAAEKVREQEQQHRNTKN